ncbi:sigma 54-interacting transcriptional regulator [Marinitoga aeolica]|uniref:Sigma-54-dependent Fis family transcriptional regulator n=1 Tax=Marinitoga aeolica TaxID=2809031 RepID=A0ABY8PRA9_9BACT|nr:sigma 54-interacting transcriptional regulator [Marinitoga aeolica]WGS65163.1 sigma-54-dependent Fis family transcriptional regulator [Marinitoga aeolica]
MIYISKKEKYIDDIIESLEKQFNEKEEKISITELFCKDIDSADLCILEEKELLKKGERKRKNPALKNKNGNLLKKIKDKKIVLIVEDKIKGEIFEKFLEYEIIGIFRKKRLMYEFEEIGKFEKLLKEYIRNINYGLKTKGNKLYMDIPYKKLRDWKFYPDTEDVYGFYEKNKYVSIFLDPTMKDFSKKLRVIIRDFKLAMNKYSEILENINKVIEDKKNLEILDKNLSALNEKIFLPSLLIEGETGTGKTLIAEIISSVISNQIYKFSLSNISKELVDSELFGTREGAFTDAKNRKGKILTNVGKCVFLDEIAEIPTDVQTKLLLYLDDFKIRPEGLDGSPILAPAFIIAATNRDLRREINNNKFREDLYYRFKYKIKIPSLRERKEDLRFLINFILLNPYINHFDKDKNKYQIEKISLDAIEKLENYSYPGNFRELEGILKNAVNMASAENLDIILDKHIAY